LARDRKAGAAVLAVQDMQIAEHGGLTGVRDDGLVEPALMRPRNMVAYEDCDDIAQLAAAYAYGISKIMGL
jgi:death-on-curing protein